MLCCCCDYLFSFSLLVHFFSVSLSFSFCFVSSFSLSLSHCVSSSCSFCFCLSQYLVLSSFSVFSFRLSATLQHLTLPYFCGLVSFLFFFKGGLRGPAAILFISRDTCSDSIANVFRACFYGVSHNYRAIRCKMGIARMRLCKTKYQGGVSHHFVGVLVSLKKYRAIWGIAAIVSQYRAIWGH